VLAARLSEDAGCRVLLVESGPDYPAELPADIADGSAPAFSHDWGYTAEDSGVALPRARLVGGCSATNAGMLLRGRPADYDGRGPGWSYGDLLPVFQAVEADPLHG